MTFNYTIPLWGVIAFSVPFVFALIGGAYRLIYKQKEQDNQILQLTTKVSQLEEDLKQEQNQLYKEIKSLDVKFSDQRLVLEAIKTTLELMLNQKIKINAGN
ncbi:hypothetical protein CLV24_1146 [Pontibacter ummariensis]|uniref:Phage shock protein B n=1 Tax=Pontibacter ummariensis TaxID=1610492 RepID=A0A239HK98_9BACT|nr:hypothetical protein [Pontibacter ummariensis]PRY10278.1 hypothetical protein CLV24_1146 [Pontibacter ummariensis]SNS81253.1 hypothetical protein SAMN06296052_1146 [Pontibacter ummariensis]